MEIVDTSAIHQARSFVKTALATALKDLLTALYQKNHQGEVGELNSDVVAKRKIKNICLDYLSQIEQGDSYYLANQQFAQAKTMTDQISALGAIVNSDNPAKDNCLAGFYEQWEDEALVIDKWFTLQATSSQDNTLTTVKNLLNHTAFDLKNPNRVRSLIGAFSQANPVHFHADNGLGYQFLADQIIALNSLNPQVASRMVGALTSWRRFDTSRQTLIKAQLERIINTKNISKDVFEVANKSLT
jgi:aminopeptidase N